MKLVRIPVLKDNNPEGIYDIAYINLDSIDCINQYYNNIYIIYINNKEIRVTESTIKKLLALCNGVSFIYQDKK